VQRLFLIFLRYFIKTARQLWSTNAKKEDKNSSTREKHNLLSDKKSGFMASQFKRHDTEKKIKKSGVGLFMV